MAVRDPNNNRLTRDAQGNIIPDERPVMPRRTGFAWMWIWVVIIIAVFWFAGWGWGGYGGWWWGGRRAGVVGRVNGTTNGVNGNPQYPQNGANTVPNNANTSNGNNEQASIGGYNGVTGQGLAMLEANNKQQYVNQTFNIANVPVQSKVSDHVFWIGQTPASRMLVVEKKNAKTNHAANINAGKQNWVDVNGKVEKAPSVAQAKKEWGLSEDGAKQLEQQGAYVMAQNVQQAEPLAQPVNR